jgi:uncharacterized protein YbjT (DUF2867 family)
MQNKILVTGATNDLGIEIIRQLSSKGVDLRAAVHSLGKADKIGLPGVDLIKVDFDKPETLKEAFVGIDKLFLLTPFAENMVQMTENLVDQAIKSGVGHIVKLSIINADKERIPMTKLHRQAEYIVGNSGIQFTFLRPNYFMQNFSTLMGATIRNEGIFYSLNAEGKISYVDARDVAAVATEALTKEGHHGKAYTITGSEALSNGQIADILSKVIGETVKYIMFSEDEAKRGMKAIGMSDWFMNSLQGISKDQEEGHMSTISSDVERITGRRPISFAQFANDYINVFR